MPALEKQTIYHGVGSLATIDNCRLCHSTSQSSRFVLTDCPTFQETETSEPKTERVKLEKVEDNLAICLHECANRTIFIMSAGEPPVEP